MNIRPATFQDIPFVVAMLADDDLGKTREDFRDPLPESYFVAFSKIESDPNQELVVMENDEQQIIGTLQLSFLQYLTYRGGIRAQIEAVRVHKEFRGQGIGQKLFLWAIEHARIKGAHVVQLTTDKKRPDALRFYEQLGFNTTHEGLKLHF